jgi:2,3-dihydroxyphenylpropionate 1,2-dioxygenase
MSVLTSSAVNGSTFLACVPHVPLVSLQEEAVNAPFWEAYHARVRQFKQFDPELVIVFGGDHYDSIFLKMMPQFVIGQIAEAIADCGGYAGKLAVPRDIAAACARHMVDHRFDVNVSYAMELDHGFSNVLHHFIGELDAKPVLPVHINSLSDPQPTFRRCRELGAEIGRFAATLGKRVAFLGSGGLSHQTDFIFPQYDSAPNEDVRNYIVHGGVPGGISRQKWMNDIDGGMQNLSADLQAGTFKAPWINREWDEQFLATFASGDLSAFDSWTDADVQAAAGYGGGEVRQWIAAAAAAQAAGGGVVEIDFYSSDTTFAVGAGIAHAI